MLADAYWMYRLEYSYAMGNVNGVCTVRKFVGAVAYALIFQLDKFVNIAGVARATRNRGADDVAPLDKPTDMLHALKSFSCLEQYLHLKGNKSTRPRRHCVVCRKLTSFFCVECSKPFTGYFVPVCNPSWFNVRRECLCKHSSCVEENELA
jgi:hypothetical protein